METPSEFLIIFLCFYLFLFWGGGVFRVWLLLLDLFSLSCLSMQWSFCILWYMKVNKRCLFSCLFVLPPYPFAFPFLLSFLFSSPVPNVWCSSSVCQPCFYYTYLQPSLFYYLSFLNFPSPQASIIIPRENPRYTNPWSMLDVVVQHSSCFYD